MSNHDPESFKNEPWGLKLLIILAVSLIILGSVAFVFGVFYFGLLGVFALLGVHYDNLYALFLFTLFYLLLSIVSDVLIKIAQILLRLLRFDQRRMLKLALLFAVAFSVNLSIILFLDDLMGSITLEKGTKIIVAVLITIADLLTDWDGKQTKKKDR